MGGLIQYLDSKSMILYNRFMKETKKKDGKISDVVALELRRLGVVLEHVDDKISLVAEQHGDIQKNIEIIKTDIEFIKHGLKRKVDVEEFAALERRVSILEKRR